MRDAIVIAPSGIGLEDIAATLPDARFASEGNEEPRLLVGGVEIRRDQSLAEHYENEEGERIRSVGDDPQFFLVNFKNITDIRDVISSISTNSVVIDNDFGLIEPISSFVKRWQQNPEWDWIE
jgi:hypothetical protein